VCGLAFIVGAISFSVLARVRRFRIIEEADASRNLR
jgi:hypothetical protein